MAGSSLIVAVNALLLKRLQLPRAVAESQPPTPGAHQRLPEPAPRRREPYSEQQEKR
jgi:hypothetical protein